MAAILALQQKKASQTMLFLAVTLAILFGTLWTSIYASRRITVPIKALAEATSRLAEGEVGHRVEVEATDEVGRLIDSFNDMSGQLAQQRKQLTDTNRFMATVLTASADDGVSVVLSSHVLAELERVADYLVLMSRGRVQVAGEVDDLLASHRMLTGPADQASEYAERPVVHVRRAAAQAHLLIRATAADQRVAERSAAQMIGAGAPVAGGRLGRRRERE